MTPNKILGVFSKNSLLLSGLIGIVITMIASSMILSTTMERHQSFARCPNGYHISPSGVCEQVIQPSTELPRCPNGYHRSPSLVCEQQPQYPPQAQFSQQQQQQGQPLYNVTQVVNCLNKVLADSIMKALSLIIQNNLNGTLSLGLKEAFVTNATNMLDACIIPRR